MTNSEFDKQQWYKDMRVYVFGMPHLVKGVSFARNELFVSMSNSISMAHWIHCKYVGIDPIATDKEKEDETK